MAGERETGRSGHTDEQGRTGTDRDRGEKKDLSEGREASFKRDGRVRTTRETQRSMSVNDSPCSSTSESLNSAGLAANAALSIINLACYLLDRQVAAQAEAFEKQGFQKKMNLFASPIVHLGTQKLHGQFQGGNL